MKAGLSTACFYPMHTEEALGQIAQLGVKTVEIFMNSFSELQPSFIRTLRQTLDENGMRVTSIHPFTSGYESYLFFGSYDRRFTDGLELYRQYYDCAAALGADIVVFHGYRKDGKKSYAEIIDRYGRMAEDAKRYGIRLAHENVYRCVGGEPAFFQALIGAIPDVPLVFDVKQAIRSGYQPADFFNVMRKNICHVHISDHTETESCLPVGEGTFDLSGLDRALRADGFNGAVIEELYSNNFTDAAHLLKSYRRLQQIIESDR